MSFPLPPKSKFGCLINGNMNTQNSTIDFGFFVVVTNYQLDLPMVCSDLFICSKTRLSPIFTFRESDVHEL